TAKNSHTLSHMKDPYDHEQILHNKITFSEKDQDNFSGVGQSYDIVLNDSEFGKY
ncbi:MAG: hypothetical protein K0R90_973, partial [Oscillospiraceae bacterium]|nr:hypothetical protein [Oscillospiraceae bacterium]